MFLLTVSFLATFVARASADLPTLSLTATQPLSAFTPGHPPTIQIKLAAKSEWHGFIRVERFDLLSEKAAVDFISADALEGKTAEESYKPTVPFGVYRIDAALVGSRSEIPAKDKTTRLFFAYAPARDPHQLPDDWPLGEHVTFEDPPLPGFKWYRYFSSWAEDNPAKGTYDWSHLDAVVPRVRDIGGRLLIANDTTPSWTAPDKPVTRPWVKSATAYPPNDMADFRTYLDALLARYDDKAGTIGGLEVWNEANTPDRWMGTPAQMVELAKIFREAAVASQKRVQRDAPAKIVGIAVSSGHQQDYVNGVIKAGILPFCDVVSAHWYEEMLTYDRGTPINSLPMHVDLVAKPMHDAGFSLPFWNSESGIGAVPREDGRIVPQDELNRRYAKPFDPKQPWMLDKDQWRSVSERRSAASFVAGTAMLMGLGVEKTFVYSMRDEHWIADNAPSLSWVALSAFGDQLRSVDYHTIVPVEIVGQTADAKERTLAYRFGAPNKPGLIVAWRYAQDLTVGRPKLWQPWLDPQPVTLKVNAGHVEVIDLYARDKKSLVVESGAVTIPIGEEPVYLRELSP